MFADILVAVDFSGRHAEALEAAAQLAGQASGRVTLMHIIEEIPGLAREEEADFYARLEEEGLAKLSQLATRLRGAEIEHAIELRFGHPARTLLEAIDTLAPSLLVMSSHAADPSDPNARWSSVSYAVGMTAPCPVLLIK